MHNLIPLFFEGKRIVAFTSNNVPWFQFNDVLDALGVDDWDKGICLRLKEHETAIADVVDSDCGTNGGHQFVRPVQGCRL